MSLCDRTGNMVAPWAAAGFPCVIVDTQHPPGVTAFAENVTAIGCDVREWIGYEGRFAPGIVFAFPPCTHLASSGARWFASKGLPPLIESLAMVEACRAIAESAGGPWMIENPVGRLSTCWRKPDYAFDPCDFGGYLDPAGDAYTKRTCLWTGRRFRDAGPAAGRPRRGVEDAPPPARPRPGEPSERDAERVCPRGVRREPE
jgi:hypothetical protein